MSEVSSGKSAAARRWTQVVRDLMPFPRTRTIDIPSHHTPKGLPKEVPSICPECRQRVVATLYQKDGQVFMGKSCPNHGEFKDLIYSHAEMYLKMEKWTFGDMKGIENPVVERAANCPEDCGLCNQHISTACMTILDLTNRCNLNCSYCFANANSTGYKYSVTRAQITKMLEQVRDVRPGRCKTIQYSGGEPTIHPDFFWAVREAKRIGFPYVIAATNGVTIGKSLDFARKAKASGLDAVYLQFDGVEDEVNDEIRGVKLASLKKKCIEHCEKTGIRVTLVPTLARGVNDSQIGSILEVAIDHLDIVNGISFQPVSFTGRISYEERIKQRYTLSDMAHAVYEQTGIAHPMKDWYPLSFVSPLSRLMEALSGRPTMTISCHSDCGIGCYLIINRKGEAYPITQFLDLEGAFAELNEISDKLRGILKKPLYFAHAIRIVKKYFKHRDVPPGMTLGDFLGALGPTLIRRQSEVGKRREWRFLILLGMHFQDEYNYNIDRVKRCVIHYSAPNGRIYSFCTYNSGPLYRTQVEKEFSRPLRR